MSLTSDNIGTPALRRSSSAMVTEPVDLKKAAQAWAEELEEPNVHSFLVLAMVQRLSLYVERQFTALARGYGVNSGDLRILLALARSAPDHALRPTELFNQLLITSGAVSKQVDRLASLGLVRRTTHPSDVRIQLVSLEDRGHEIAKNAMRTITTSFCGVESLDQSQNAEIVSALELLLQTVEDASLGNAGEVEK